MRKKFLVASLVALMAFSSVSVMAANSPSGDNYYNISIGDSTTGNTGNSSATIPGGDINSSTGAVKVGEEVTFTATPKGNNKFSHWVIKGDYTIVKGDLQTSPITIIPKGDISVTAVFVDANGNEIKADTTEESTDDNGQIDVDVTDDDEDVITVVNKDKDDNSNTDDSNTSPKTGVPTEALFVTLLASGAVVLTTRKKLND